MRDIQTLEKDVEIFKKSLVQKNEKPIQELVLEIERLTHELKRKSEISSSS